MSAVLESIELPEYELKPKRRRLTLFDAQAIARIVARRKCSESEACRLLNIYPKQWGVFKCRKKVSAVFEAIIEGTKGLTINHAMERIETAGIRDWRADHARLALIDPKRFGNQANEDTSKQASIITDNALKVILDKVFTQGSKSVIECEPLKQIESTHQD